MLAAHAENRVAEALVFEGEGLALGERIAHDLALADPAEGRDGVPLQGRVAVLVEGQVPHGGVGDERAALPRHDGRTVLVGGQPVDEVVDENAAGKHARSDHHVLVRPTRTRGGARVDALVGGTGHPRGQVHVVRGQVLHHADVADARGEGRLAARRDLLDVAELALSDPPTHVDERGVAALDVADGTHEARTREGVADAPARLHARGEGLFDEGVYPGLGQRQGCGFVVGGGGSDDRRVDTGLDQFFDAAEDGQVAGDAEAVAARIRERDEVYPPRGAGVAHVVSAHRADAEDS